MSKENFGYDNMTSEETLSLFVKIHNNAPEISKKLKLEIAQMYLEYERGRRIENKKFLSDIKSKIELSGLKDKTPLVGFYQFFFNYHMKRKEYNEGKEYLNNLLELLMYVNSEYRSVIHCSVGVYYFVVKKYDKSLEYYLKSINDCSDSSLIATRLVNIGDVYKKKGDIDKTLEYYRESLLYADMGNHICKKAYAYRKIGIIYENRKKYQKAYELVEKAKELFTSLNKRRDVMICEKYLSIILFQQDKPRKAWASYQIAHALAFEQRLTKKYDLKKLTYTKFIKKYQEEV